MLFHRALGRDLHKLVIAVVDNRRPMLLVTRAMLAAIGAGRVHTYESPTGAIGTMQTAIPDLVIAADVMQPLNGPALVRSMRRPSSGELALVPVIIITAHAKPALVDRGPIRCSRCRLRQSRSPADSTGSSTTIAPSSSRATIMSFRELRSA
jgi:CheY-like chemotaxis protein